MNWDELKDLRDRIRKQGRAFPLRCRVGARGEGHAGSRCTKRWMKWKEKCEKHVPVIYDREIIGEWIPEVTPC